MEEETTKKKRRLTAEQVQRLLSLEVRPPIPVGEERWSDDPDIIANMVLLLNYNAQRISQLQANARQDLLTKGYVEIDDDHE